MNQDSAGHRRRLWAKFQERGLREGFHGSYEKLEFLLTFALPRVDTKPVAKALMTAFGTLNGVVSAPSGKLRSVAGVGERAAGLLRCLGEMALILAEEKMQMGDVFANPQAVMAYLKRELAMEEAEYFFVFYLDQQHHLLKTSRLFRGTHNLATVYPREVVKEALACNAAGTIVAHNHPSGRAEPSSKDLSLTKVLARSLSLVGIQLLDHFIVGKNEVLSLRESGHYKGGNNR